MELIQAALPAFLRGALNTLIYCGISFPLAVLLGIVLAAMSTSPFLFLRWPALGFIELMRNTPMITQLLLLYYGVGAVLAQMNLATWVNAWTAGVTALALNYGAYEAEVFRAGLQAVDVGQREAALSLGMSQQQGFVRIILPQAIQIVIPPLVNDFIYMLKDSAIVSVIAGVDLTSVMRVWVIRNSSQPFPLYALALILYLLMSLPIAWWGRRLEQRLKAKIS
ncbi:amino acid ABC transporter permease [Thermosynechococcus sp. QKsg1]|uniref:amino acid ABC transporter permease n=1 Tax=unclassified Thermosynechococcus TaxID=2622553 RepID=UPI00122E9C15|nr:MULTISPECIES: amino acid ABC transporter permease [unclassified Thermosynechococcus]QEQ02003.1 amino acid ABC transporter permease [Thermosynechococcus sp. CL-1]WJI23891.1 amino acid ABC transporter permease [Thermosynechococcus sp. B0]WJI26404.1 amino acid ABC transporter permease [Thermosynechococcus sp. B1]WJI28931.1 amino acid ABC transporter permease [Thermosynechococcus sp. B3]WKT83525.1 amino acid ABC transporter permease [Thermosynechococcus sp. HY596]